jgi:DNA segregation ATPase FtsK/SpoIIIE-like protein
MRPSRRSKDQGARCDRIRESLPGVGYVRIDGVREPTRVRAAYVTDEDIAAMAAEYGPRTTGAGRLRAVLEGHAAGGAALTAEQQREVDAIRSRWEHRQGPGS